MCVQFILWSNRVTLTSSTAYILQFIYVIHTGSAWNEDNIQSRRVFFIGFSYFFSYSVSILYLTCLLLKYWSLELISHTLFYYTVNKFFLYVCFGSSETHTEFFTIWEINLWKIEDITKLFLLFTQMNTQTNK